MALGDTLAGIGQNVRNVVTNVASRLPSIGPTPADTTNRPENPSRVQSGDISAQWNDWLAKPGNRSAMVQMGLALLQPMGLGETTGGHIARGVASGFQAKDRVLKTAQETQQSTANLAKTKADTAESLARAKYYDAGGAGGALASQAKLDDAARARWLKYFVDRTDPILGDVNPNDPAAVAQLFAQWKAADDAFTSAQGGAQGTLSSAIPATPAPATSSPLDGVDRPAGTRVRGPDGTIWTSAGGGKWNRG